MLRFEGTPLRLPRLQPWEAGCNMQMNKPAIRHPRWSSPSRAAVFRTASSHSRDGLKQSASRYAQNLQITLGLLRPSRPSVSPSRVQTRAAINPAGRAANRGKHFILFRSPRGYYVCRGVAWKCWTNGRRGDNERDGQLRGLMALHRLRPALTRGPQCTFVSIPTTSHGLPSSFFFHSFPHPCHIADKSVYFRPNEKKKREIFALTTAAITRAWAKARQVTVRKYLLYSRDFLNRSWTIEHDISISPLYYIKSILNFSDSIWIFISRD